MIKLFEMKRNFGYVTYKTEDDFIWPYTCLG